MRQADMTITTHLDIVSAERQIFSGLVEMVVASGELGEVGITPGHAPLLTLLKPGEVRITLPGGEQEIFYVQGGMLEVQPHCISVLADVAERADHLDETAAIELARAVAQIRAIQKVRKNVK